MDLYELLQGHIAAFLLTLTRISGIFLISPFFGSMNIAPFFRVGIALAMTDVVILAYFVARTFGKSSMRTLAARGGQVYLQLPLGPNRSVCVVELFGRIFVLGVTDTNIRLITEIDDPETVEEIRSAEPPAGGVFQEQFGSLSDFVQKIPPLFRK